MPLASIPGQLVGSLRPGSAWWEPEPDGALVPTRGDRGLQVGEAGVDEGGVVAAQVQRAGGAGIVNVQVPVESRKSRHRVTAIWRIFH
jgi:hypothetical protein